MSSPPRWSCPPPPHPLRLVIAAYVMLAMCRVGASAGVGFGSSGIPVKGTPEGVVVKTLPKLTSTL